MALRRPGARIGAHFALALALAGASAALMPAAVRACSRAPESRIEYAIDPAATPGDDRPPTAFSDVQAFVSRRTDTVCSAGECTTTSCGDHGTIELSFTRPSDDRTAPDDLGYRIELIEGHMPESMRPLIGPRWPLTPVIVIDVGFDEVVALDATIALIAIDRAGNESVASEPIHLMFSGCTKPPTGETCMGQAEGCAVAIGGTRAADAAVVAFALFAMRARRRGSRR